jgi:hypothetical protein
LGGHDGAQSGDYSSTDLRQVADNLRAGSAGRLVYPAHGVQRIPRIAAPVQSVERHSKQTASLYSKVFLGAKAWLSYARRLGPEKRRCRFQMIRAEGDHLFGLPRPLYFSCQCRKLRIG